MKGTQESLTTVVVNIERTGPPSTAAGPPDPAKANSNGSRPASSGGKLNPRWVEALMGLPLGHSQLSRKFVKPRTTA